MYINFGVDQHWARQYSKSNVERIYQAFISWNEYEKYPFLWMVTDDGRVKYKITKALFKEKLEEARRILDI
jgi:hypothetical protein